MAEMENVKIKQLSSDKGPVVGCVIVADQDIKTSAPAVISDGVNIAMAPIQFYSGDLNLIRSELHRSVDEAIDLLME